MALTTSCAACVFGAYSSTVLTYPDYAVETVIVEAIPQVTVYANGSRATSTEFSTSTEDIVYPLASAGPPTTFTDAADITWVVDDATLIYPNTYVQYLGFAGAVTRSSERCVAQTDVTSIKLPASTNAAEYIYLANETLGGLPHNLLDYLSEISGVEEQFYDIPLSDCAAYTEPTYTAQIEASLEGRQVSAVPTPLPLSTVPTPRRFEGPLNAQNAVVTPIQALLNGTWEKRAIGSGSGSGSGTAPKAASPSAAEESSFVVQTTNPQNTHSTALLLQTITGRAIVTSVSSAVQTPGAGPTSDEEISASPLAQQNPPAPPAQQGQDTSRDGQQQVGNAGSSQATTNAGNAGAAAAGGTSDVPNFIGFIVSAAVQAQPTTANEAQTTRRDGAVPGHDTQQQSGATSINVENKPSQAVFTISGNALTAAQVGSSIVLAGSSSTTTIAQGSTATFQGQTVVAGSQGIAVGSLTAAFTQPASTISGANGQAVVTASGNTFSARQSGSSIIFEDASSTLTIPNTATGVSFDGRDISVGSIGGVIVIGGSSTVRLSTVGTSQSGSTTTGVGGYIQTALNSVVGSSTASGQAAGAALSNSACSALFQVRLGLLALGALLAVLCAM